MTRPTSLPAVAAATALLLSLSCGVSDSRAPQSEEGIVAKTEAISLETAALAQWAPLVTLPIVPVSAANLPDGKVLLWSAENRFSFGSNLGRTYTVLFDPATNTATERLVSETGHDMFCPGTANLADGRVLVNGGLSSGATSIFNPTTGAWTTADTMNIPRAYQGTTPLADGSVFTLGGSWAGGVGNKHGEVWTEAAGWRLLSGVRIDPFLSIDTTRNFGMDSHLWLLPAGNGRVFHAGPGFTMHWVDTNGAGSVLPIGPRGDDQFSINGSAVMFDIGKVLKVGGAPGYDGVTSNANSYVIELGADVTVRKLQPMTYRRAFHNAVVLPNGQVVVIGGATVAVGFSDNNSVLAPELFDPLTETFATLPPMIKPRNYHSVALLLPDGRVLSGGGGLCGNGCAANHPDLQILSPPYLFNADGTPATRPVIQTAPTEAVHGAVMAVTTDSPVSSFALVRSSSTTHALNNDQRRLPVSFHATGPGSYGVQVPTNPGWALPGLYMLFAMNAEGVPSLATTLRIGSASPISLASPPDQETLLGTTIDLTLVASSSTSAPLSFGVTGLPAGLTLDTATGVIAGAPTTAGRGLVEVSASDGEQTVSTQFVWEVTAPENEAPTLTPPAPALALVGAAATLFLDASDPDGDPLTYAAVGLPPGLSLNPGTGGISGTATLVGTYSVSASVSDGRGGSDSATFAWVVGTMPLPTVSPIIAPLATTGGAADYTASASGSGALEYQWSFGDGSPSVGFGSSPSVSHNFPGPGAYTVTLTVRNTDGNSTSTEFIQGVAGGILSGRPKASSNLAEELRAGLGARVWSVNIDNDSVSVFDRGTLAKLAEIPVGKQPRSVAIGPDGRVWVTNKGSSSLSIINPATLAVAQTVSLPLASQPFGVVVGADGFAYVALEASGILLKLNSAGVTVASGVVGPNPRHLALTAAGDRLLVSRFITPPQPGEHSATVETSVAGVKQGAQVLVVNPASLATTRTVVLEHSEKPDTTVSGRGVPNYLGAPAISPDGQSAWVPSKQDNIQRGALRDSQNLDFQNTVRAISSRIHLATEAEDIGARVDHDNSGVASAAAFHPSGVYLFVSLETSRQVAVVDAFGKRELFRVEAGLAPQAVAVSGDGHTLYVHNVLGRSVNAYDLSPLINEGSRSLPLLAQLSSVAVEKLSPEVLRGKQHFYDARDTRLSRDAYLSCASCHNDGGQDGRVWDFTGMGEGLRNTVSLRGRRGAQGRLHWTGNFDEVQDFEGQIRGLAQGTGLMADVEFNAGTRSQPLGEPKAGVSADLDALASYLASLSVADSSPFRMPTGVMTAEASAGRTLFATQCITCHGGADFTDSAALAVRNVGTLRASSGQRLGAALTGLDTPTLRGSWATAPYLHDGSAATLEAAVLAHSNLNLTALDRANVSAFVTQLGSEEPAAVAIGGGITGAYFANNSLAGTALLMRNEAVNFNWYGASPAAGLPSDNFSVRWTGQVLVRISGAYRFVVNADDGVRLWVNGGLLIDNWVVHPLTTDTSALITLTAGQSYDIRLEYRDLSGGATVQLRWQRPGMLTSRPIPIDQLFPMGAGLQAQYFANPTLTGAAALTRYEAPYFNWGNAAPAPGLPADNFSARWTGMLAVPATGSYRFQTNSDDGVRLWVNGSLVIDNFTAHAPTLNTSELISLVAGTRYDIKLEYNEFGGGAVMQLNWLVPGSSAHVAVPLGQLYGN